MAKLDERVEAIRVKYGLDASDFWELPQKKGTWVAKHSALEIAAVKADIWFDMPMIIESNGAEGVAAMAVKGTLAGGRFEWATGEASPKNNKNAYPWAMAEKRAKDRVILKLIGIHGLVYSEDEMAGSTIEAPTETNRLVKDSRESEKALRVEIDACATVTELEDLWRSKAFQTEFRKLHTIYQEGLVTTMGERRIYLNEHPAKIPPGFDRLAPNDVPEKPFPGDMS